MEEKLKEIISKYLQMPASQIHSATVINRSAVASSILLHRMYAALASAGFTISDYWNIDTFGMLMSRLGVSGEIVAVSQYKPTLFPNSAAPVASGYAQVGIDVEEISLLPKAKDFREDEFYKSNFSDTEIAYCLLQPNPYASFAGLFAVKEAIVKADNAYVNLPFNSIITDRLPGGKPVFAGFSISISHTSTLAIAVAVKLPPYVQVVPTKVPLTSTRHVLSPLHLLTVLFFLLSMFLLYIICRK